MDAIKKRIDIFECVRDIPYSLTVWHPEDIESKCKGELSRKISLSPKNSRKRIFTFLFVNPDAFIQKYSIDEEFFELIHYIAKNRE